jgi:magnesium transporter
MFVLVVVWQRDLQSASIIALSLLGSIVASCLWGLLVPTVLRRFKADPRMAAAPIALGLTDLSALALYFGLAKHLFG